MDKSPQTSLADQLLAAQNWWRDAGVDFLFENDPIAMLGEESDEEHQARPKPKTAKLELQDAAPAAPAIDIATLPQDLAGFHSWLIDPETKLPGSSKRLPPRGKPDAALMVLFPMPERDDQQSLFEGPQGVLVANILRALGLSAEDTYFASALPSHMAEPDWSDLDKAGLGAIVRHHIALAKPHKVLAFGNALAPFISDGDQAPAVPTRIIRAPEHLLTNARQRARAWHSLLEWTAP